MIKLEDVAIVIPAYEAAETLGKVLDDWFKFGAKPNQIWVIDDGSLDKTARIAESRKVRVIRHRENLGKGAAHKTGFRDVAKTRFRWVLTLDADTQHDVWEADRFLSHDPDSFDIAIGTRRNNMIGMPFDRWFVNRLTSMVLSLYGGGRQLVTDSQCGYRLMKTEVFTKIPLTTDHFDTESELVAKGLRAGYRIIEVPITTHYTSPRSHINKVLDTWRFTVLCLFRLSWR